MEAERGIVAAVVAVVGAGEGTGVVVAAAAAVDECSSEPSGL